MAIINQRAKKPSAALAEAIPQVATMGGVGTISQPDLPVAVPDAAVRHGGRGLADPTGLELLVHSALKLGGTR